MCENKYQVKKYEVDKIWAQKVQIVKNGKVVKSYKDNCEIVKLGEPIGPFFVMKDVAEATNVNISQVSKILNGEYRVSKGYEFYYQGKTKFELVVPNAGDYKAKNSVYIAPSMPFEEKMQENLEKIGFKNVKLIEENKYNSKFELDCNNVNCNNKAIRSYRDLAYYERMALCECCTSILKSVVTPKKYGEKTLQDVRPDLSKYYKSKNNNGKSFDQISSGTATKIVLQCTECDETYHAIAHNLAQNARGKMPSVRFNCNHN